MITPPLLEMGYATDYDKLTQRQVPHPTANLQEGWFYPDFILKAMGGRGVYDQNEFDLDVNLDRISSEDLRSVRIGRDFLHMGTLTLRHLPPLNFPKPVSYEEVAEAIERASNEGFRSQCVFGKVESLVAQRGLVLRDVLDLHAMHRDLLSPGKMQEERDIVIAQCKDPTFWNTVLTTGRLYNLESREFDIPVDQKYEGASSLFPN